MRGCRAQSTLVQPSPFICSERQRSMGPARKSPTTTSSRTSPRCTRARLVSSVKPSLAWVVSACCSRRCSRLQPPTPVCSRMGRLFLNSKNTKMKTSGITWSRWGPWYYLCWPSSFIGHLANRSRWSSWEPSRRERFCRFWHSPRFIFSTPEWTVNYIPARFGKYFSPSRPFAWRSSAATVLSMQ